MEYRGVVVSKKNNELKHWKYIKKVKVGGKWRYFYDDRELKKFEKGVTDVKKHTVYDKNGNATNYETETEYKRSNKIFDENGPTIRVSGSTFISGNSFESTHTTKTQGKLSRAIAKGEKYIYDTFLDKRDKKVSKNNTDSGKKTVAKILRKLAEMID